MSDLEARALTPFTEAEIDWYRPRHRADALNHRCVWDGERLPCPTMQWLATLDRERTRAYLATNPDSSISGGTE